MKIYSFKSCNKTILIQYTWEFWKYFYFCWNRDLTEEIHNFCHLSTFCDTLMKIFRNFAWQIYPVKEISWINVNVSNVLFHDMPFFNKLKIFKLLVQTKLDTNLLQLYVTASWPFSFLTQRALHFESTSIRRGYYMDTSKTKFWRISTSFPCAFSM